MKESAQKRGTNIKNNFGTKRNLQPDLNGALFNWWLSLSKPPIKKAGVEGGNVCHKKRPNRSPDVPNKQTV
ncbi:hypothetical protein [Kaistella daneshvariae]|jgi:hypothetical protein|uniref:hypothetical protein n=1 Tax=Kaistella daneshvariae TaxID=2487074 RepID=UPI0013DE3B44|nr:hypothetical protein [Kaistella daneshvariae]